MEMNRGKNPKKGYRSSSRGTVNRFWEFRLSDENPSVGELLIYGLIGSDSDPWSWFFDEVTPKQFKEELDNLGDVDVIQVKINSDGGDAFAGQAINSMLRRHPASVEVYIDGLAASAASVIAMAGDTIYMPENAMMMIHNPWSVGAGEARDFRKMADTLDKVKETIIAAYQQKSHLDADEIARLMDEETWMLASEAKEMGFIDEVEGSKAVAASLRGDHLIMNGREFDLSKFRNRPNLPKSALHTETTTGSSTTIHIHGDVYGWSDFEERIASLARSSGNEEPPEPEPVVEVQPEAPPDNTNQDSEPDEKVPQAADLSLFEKRLAIRERGI